jgi:hypothetical protein
LASVSEPELCHGSPSVRMSTLACGTSASSVAHLRQSLLQGAFRAPRASAC